jgi:methylated-DNA-[protein]-cysteine S-methyltransferase
MVRHAATVCRVTALGLVEVEAADSGVTRVRLRAHGKPREVGDSPALEVANHAMAEILSYLAGESRRFTIPVAVRGTPFQEAVWNEVASIPYGQRRTYGELALRLRRPRAARAVGTACRANPVPILVPCHRVVPANGSSGGFGGGASIKAVLLDLEQRGVDSGT